MLNSVINYDIYADIKYNTLGITDYTSKSFTDIHTMVELTDTNNIYYYDLQNNEKLEELALRIYNSESYWDLILKINNMDPLFDTIYDYDVIADLALSNINKYMSRYTTIVPQEYIDALVTAEILRLEKENEDKRQIKLILPSRLEFFMKRLRELKYIT